MNSKVMNKYFKRASSIQPVNEGWGMALGMIFGLLTAPIGLAIPIVQGRMSFNNACSVVDNPKVKKYIISECDKIFRDAKRKWPHITKTVNPKLFDPAENRTPGDKSWIGHPSIGLKHHFVGTTNVGSYLVGFIGDTDHIDGMMVYFRDTDTDKLFQINIPAPTRKDIQDMGFRKE